MRFVRTAVTQVELTKFAEKQLKKIPVHIRESLRVWIVTVERIGIQEARKLSGYHDEPLKGQRKGERSLRLNRAYRAIYVETAEGLAITVIEVSKHDY
jgi:toxin HigB-1